MPSRLRRPVAAFTAATLLLAACTTREMRIGADDGSDACYQRRVQLDSTGNFFTEDIVRGAAVGAVGGAILGGLIAAASGARGGNVAAGAGIGALAGGAAGAMGGYLVARQRQARDQAELTALIGNDLARENAELERAQLAFDLLMDCRFQQAQAIREAHRRGALPTAAAQAQLARLREQAQADVALARMVNQRIATRGAEFDTAIATIAPDVKADYETRKAVAQRSVVSARARQPVAVRLRPDPNAPEIARIAPSEPVRLRPAAAGFAKVETESGQVVGYAPASAFGTRAGGAPLRLEAPPAAPAAAAATDARSLAASNIARRDNFAESVSTAETAVRSGFELAS
ncbi:hypothetical protein [Caldovatus aquaticus]|uniref:Glycine zipper domain-containing protein n=1 Tax=Caldovatus aquaticus TaxID=2865671 RepID=A0ABS7F2C0_9PROT|nr:hypothetical protein [Caldovatus aquaticus]MBW8268945.1 hypothetical protein [Caldovatus aquaticus]